MHVMKKKSCLIYFVENPVFKISLQKDSFYERYCGRVLVN